MTDAWERVQARLRNRRDWLEGPAPAHDLLTFALGGRLHWALQRSEEGMMGQALIHLMNVCAYLEEHAARDGSLWARQQADEALSFALRLAGRLCAGKTH